MKEKQIIDTICNWNRNNDFSGVISVSKEKELIFQEAYGYRNKPEKLLNNVNTKIAIASGTKLFTALAICKLIDKGLFSLNDRICDLIDQDLKTINKKVTVFHLLTHTSGIGDYLDEDLLVEQFDILKLYENHPVHKWESLSYYLPMFNELPQKFNPGEHFDYSNAGFILLGLIIESISKNTYQQYILQNIISSLGLLHTGFYRMNNLPENTAIGYLYNESLKEFESNVLYMPIMGGSDGGIFTSASDLEKLWKGIISNNIFSEKMKKQIFEKHIIRDECKYYGLGIYIREELHRKAYYAIGVDFGVNFFTAYFPKCDIIASALGNMEKNTLTLFQELFLLIK